MVVYLLVFFFFKQKTAYDIGWCDWSSDVCSSDLGALIRRLPSYGKLALALARHPRLSRVRRAAVVAAAAYVFSPIDLIPGIIPVVGQLDDILVAITAIRFALEGLRPEFRAE